MLKLSALALRQTLNLPESTRMGYAESELGNWEGYVKTANGSRFAKSSEAVD